MSNDHIDSRVESIYKQYKTVYAAPQVMDAAKDENGVAVPWGYYQAMVRAHNDTLPTNQWLWAKKIRNAEKATGIKASMVTLKAAGLGD